MKKETVIAILLGIGFGVVVAVGVVVKNKQVQLQKALPLLNTTRVPTPSITTDTSDVLDLTSPENGKVVTTNSITLTGKVSKGSTVIVQSSVKTVIIKNSSEDLNVDFPVAFGDNIIDIVVYPKDSQLRTREKTLEIYYLDEQ